MFSQKIQTFFLFLGCLKNFFAGATVWIVTLFMDESVIKIDAANALVALGLAVFCTLLGHSIFSWGLRYEKASFISTVKLLEPVFVSLMAAVIFYEIPSQSQNDLSWL